MAGSDWDELLATFSEELSNLPPAVRERLANRLMTIGFRTRPRTMNALRELGTEILALRERAEAAEAKLAAVATALDGPDPVAAAKAALSA